VVRRPPATYICPIAKARKSKPRERRHERRATLIKGTPARYLGHAHAPHEQSAIEEAATEFRVPENLRDDWWSRL
jgi:hypothetical protein